jgi:uncharacterized protein YjbI with pentapeptide repeats
MEGAMTEIRTKPALQRWTGDAWEAIGGQVIATVEGASLEGADLRGRKLDSADLRQARLRGADFTGASLAGADLSLADLTDACFRRATLMAADLRGAVLDGADLGEAFLAGTHLEGADVRRAHLQEAKLRGCYFDETTHWPCGFDPWERGAGPPARLEQRAREWMDAGMTPEAYAGRHGHTVLVFGATRYQFRDPEVTRWMRRLGEILADPRLLGDCQRKFLTPAELEAIRLAEGLAANGPSSSP